MSEIKLKKKYQVSGFIPVCTSCKQDICGTIYIPNDYLTLIHYLQEMPVCGVDGCVNYCTSKVARRFLFATNRNDLVTSYLVERRLTGKLNEPS